MEQQAQTDSLPVVEYSGIKQEPVDSTAHLLSTALSPPKRPLDFHEADEPDDAKRLKMEHESIADQLLDVDMDLLVQNALGDVSSLVNLVSGVDALPPIDSTPIPDASDRSIRFPSQEPPLSVPTDFLKDPHGSIRTMSLSILGNLSLQLLVILSTEPFADVAKALDDTESDAHKAFRSVRSLFDQTWQVYPESQGWLSTEDLELRSDDDHKTIQAANLARFCCKALQGERSDLGSLSDAFFNVLLPGESSLPADMGDLFLSFQTQSLIGKLIEDGQPKSSDALAEEYLVSGIRKRLQQRHPEADLTQDEQNLIASAQSRKDIVSTGLQQDEGADLLDKYPLDGFRQQFNRYLRDNLSVLASLGKKHGISLPQPDLSKTDLDDAMDLDVIEVSSFEKSTGGLVQDILAGLISAVPLETEPDIAPAKSEDPNNAETKDTEELVAETEVTSGKNDLTTDFKELEALVAESTSDYVRNTLNGLSRVSYQLPTVPTPTGESNSVVNSPAALNLLEENDILAMLTSETLKAFTGAEPPPSNPYPSHISQAPPQNPFYGYGHATPETQAQLPAAGGDNLPPSQSLPSAILYDKARQAALSKSSAHTRREGIHSTRRPWTQEEEKALMAGLDMVKGPHWSQILSLFGPNGSISDILKDRTQVQLKDKARNLKLFFLKTNSEMPYYLQAVTGELKTRAPTQAARKEAEERARLNSEEDQARINGIMTLAGGLQNHRPATARPGQTAGTLAPATSAVHSVVTPAQAALAAQAAQNTAQGIQHPGQPRLAPSTTKPPTLSPAPSIPGVPTFPHTAAALAHQAQKGPSQIIQAGLHHLTHVAPRPAPMLLPHSTPTTQPAALQPAHGVQLNQQTQPSTKPLLQPAPAVQSSAHPTTQPAPPSQLQQRILPQANQQTAPQSGSDSAQGLATQPPILPAQRAVQQQQQTPQESNQPALQTSQTETHPQQLLQALPLPSAPPSYSVPQSAPQQPAQQPTPQKTVQPTSGQPEHLASPQKAATQLPTQNVPVQQQHQSPNPTPTPQTQDKPTTQHTLSPVQTASASEAISVPPDLTPRLTAAQEKDASFIQRLQEAMAGVSS